MLPLHRPTLNSVSWKHQTCKVRNESISIPFQLCPTLHDLICNKLGHHTRRSASSRPLSAKAAWLSSSEAFRLQPPVETALNQAPATLELCTNLRTLLPDHELRNQKGSKQEPVVGRIKSASWSHGHCGNSGWHLEVRAGEVLLACRELGLRVLLLCLGHATTVICVPRSTSLHKSPVCMPKYTHSTIVRSEIKYIKSECLQLRVFRQ